MIRYHARWVLPIVAPPIEHGTVVVDGSHIAWVGARHAAPAGDDVELGDVLLMPGLVNAHCHLELTAMRGFLEDLDFRSWILRLTTSKRAVLTRDMLLDSARMGLVEGVRAGVTSYADTCDSGVVFDAMIERGVRGIMYQEVFGPDPAQCEGSMAELRAKVDAARPRETELVRIGISPHAPYTVSDELFAAAGAYSQESSLPMAIHIAESEVESLLVAEASGAFADGLRKRSIPVASRARSPIALLEKTGALAARPLLIHCVRLDETDIGTIATSRSPIAHCPASNAKLGHGIAPLAELLDAGVEVGLGSDSVASNNRMDILEEARLAVLFQRARLGVAHRPTAEAALALATIGGARAIGISDQVGTLEPGKAADLAAFSIGPAAPVHDPVAAAVFSINGHHAHFVAVNGRPLVRDGEVLNQDPHLAHRVQGYSEALRQWLAENPRPTPPPSPTR